MTPAEQWQSLGPKRKIFRTPVFAVCAEKHRCLRTGAEIDFNTISACNWVNIFAVTSEKKLLMIRQYRPGTHAVEWEFPGGCIDPQDPSPLEAGIRELMEETGYAGDSARVIGSIAPNPAILNNLCYTVLVENARQISAPQMEATESIETFLLDKEEVWKMVRSGEIRHGIVLNVLLFAQLAGVL